MKERLRRHHAEIRRNGKFAASADGAPIYRGVLKINNQTELYRRITQLIVDISGEHPGFVDDPKRTGEAAASALWIQALPAIIYGGCSEVQGDIVSRQVLKMSGLRVGPGL